LNFTPSTAQFLADLIVVTHFAFVLYVLCGALLLLKWPRSMWLHLPCVLWGILVEFTGWLCPLTPMENHFRELAGLELYSGDFVMQYIMPVLYPRELTRELQMVFGSIVLLLNLSIYGYIWKRHLKMNFRK
jgi:hypothetical protein